MGGTLRDHTEHGPFRQREFLPRHHEEKTVLKPARVGTVARLAAVPRLILLCGLPGSGKTTRARELAAVHRALRFSPDEWMAALEIDGYDQWARQRIEDLQWTVAEEALRAGTSVVVEWGLWTRADRDVLRARGRAVGAPVELHYLDVPIDTLWARLETRNANPPRGSFVVARDDLVEWAESFEAPTDDEMSQFDPPA
jgi:predicted kinase